MSPAMSWLLVLLVCTLAWLALVVLDGVAEELYAAREVADDDRDAAVFATVAEAQPDFEPRVPAPRRSSETPLHDDLAVEMFRRQLDEGGWPA